MKRCKYHLIPIDKNIKGSALVKLGYILVKLGSALFVNSITQM